MTQMKKRLLIFTILSFLLFACNDYEKTTTIVSPPKAKLTTIASKEQNSIDPAISFLNAAFLETEQVHTRGKGTHPYSTDDIDYIEDLNYDDGSPLLKLVCFKRNGYILLNNSNEIKNTDVLFYSTEKFDKNNINPGLIEYIIEFIDFYEHQKEKMKKEDKAPPLTRGTMPIVDTYEVKRFVLSSTINTAEHIGPLLSTAWHQEDPYNLSCPIIGGDHAVVGCVAIATGQIINFHKKHAHKKYDWARMNKKNKEKEDDKYLADFLYDVGKGVDMKYGKKESGASSSNADIHLRYIGYRVYRNAYDYEVVKRQIINKNYPVYLFGKSERKEIKFILRWGWKYKGGHAWVTDGYKRVFCKDRVRYTEITNGSISDQYERDEYKNIEFLHMNWGWGEDDNTWVTYDYKNFYTLKNKEKNGDEYKYKKGMILCHP